MRVRDLGTIALLAALVVTTHGFAGNVAWSFYQAGNAIFDPGGGPGTGGGSPSPSSSDGFPETPFQTPATADSRINVLLVGIDSSAQRAHALTDTLIVASVDPTTGATSMVSFPRDIARFPLYDGGTFSGKINSLMTFANNHPERFPDGGMPTLMRELGYLLGIPIQYYAAVNLDGFVRLVDAMGTITIDNPRAIDDPSYGGWSDGRVGFRLTAGLHDLGGEEALAFARSRKGSGDNDFTRASRQQLLLQAVRRKLTDPSMLPRLPAILDAAGKTLRTNFPQDRLSEMLTLARRVDDAGVKRAVLGPPYSVHPPTNTTGGTYILLLDLAKVRALSIEYYGPDSAFWTPADASPPPAASPASSP